MRKVLLGLIAVAAFGFACLAPLPQANAQWGYGGRYHGGWGGYGHYGYHPWRGHYDYHGPSLQFHGNHFDYVPGHYHYHHRNHYHW